MEHDLLKHIYKYSSFEVHELKGWISSLYLVVYKKKMMLLDCGCVVDGPRVKFYIIETLKRSFSDLLLVFSTHAHPDHLGGARFFLRHGIQVYSHYNQMLWYQKISGKLAYCLDLFAAQVVANLKSRPLRWLGYWPSTKGFRYLYHLDHVPDFEEWRCIYTPGHTDYDLSVYCERERIIYLADFIVLKKKIELALPYPLFNPEKYLKSFHYLSHCLQIEDAFLAHQGKIEFDSDKIKKTLLQSLGKSRRYRNTLFLVVFKLLKLIVKNIKS